MYKHPVISNLIALAKTSTMTSRHAAAVLRGHQALSSAINYSLPTGELVDTAAQANRVFKGGAGYAPQRLPCCGSTLGQTTPFNKLYQRYSHDVIGSRFEHQQRVQEEIHRRRCEKGAKA